MNLQQEQARMKQSSASLSRDYRYLLEFTFPKLALGQSSINGKGIIAKENIKKGDIVCPLFGMIYPMLKAKIKYPKYSYQLSDDIAIETTNEPGFFNHSCNPNTYINSDWLFVAMKNIYINEEIVIDYGMFDYSDYKFDCTCGSKKCRKSFNGLLAANSDYQKRYSEFFSPYLKQKFNLN